MGGRSQQHFVIFVYKEKWTRGGGLVKFLVLCDIDRDKKNILTGALTMCIYEVLQKGRTSEVG